MSLHADLHELAQRISPNHVPNAHGILEYVGAIVAYLENDLKVPDPPEPLASVPVVKTAEEEIADLKAVIHKLVSGQQQLAAELGSKEAKQNPPTATAYDGPSEEEAA